MASYDDQGIPTDPEANYAVALRSVDGVPVTLCGTEKSVAPLLRNAALAGEISGDASVTLQRLTDSGTWLKTKTLVRKLPCLRLITRSYLGTSGIWAFQSAGLLRWGQPSPVIMPRVGHWDSQRVGPATTPILNAPGLVAVLLRRRCG